MRRISYWVVFASTLALAAAIFAWSLPVLVADAGGLSPFDARPGGYSFDDAKALLTAYSPDGIAFYLGPQHLLDWFYPAALSATLYFAIATLLLKRLGVWRWIVAAVAIPGAIFDFMENAAVTGLLIVGPAGIAPQQVEAANRWTLLKGTSTTIAMTLVLALLIWWGAVRLMRRSTKLPEIQ